MSLRALLTTRRRVIVLAAIGCLLLLAGGMLVVLWRPPASAARVCAPSSNPTTATVTASQVLPPGVTQPVNLPAGEPKVVATVNGEPIYAVGLELRVQGTLANQRRLQQQFQNAPESLPPQVAASMQRTTNQIRHDALAQMIQECLLLQEGKRLGLTASPAAARAQARQVVASIEALPVNDPSRASYEAYLAANHLTEQTFVTNPGVLRGYGQTLTIAAVRRHIVSGLPAGELPQAGINAYVQRLWQKGHVHVYLPAQLGW